jgi:PRTRC genetic system protein E
MSLFEELFTLTRARRFALLVSSNHETGLLTISVMPRAANASDAAYCKDLTLTAKPEEFDADFIEALGAYRSKLLPLLEQAKAVEAAIEQGCQHAKSRAKNQPENPGALKGVPQSPTSPMTKAKAQQYREASSGDAGDDDEPDSDWMKNRQPELF